MWWSIPRASSRPRSWWPPSLTCWYRRRRTQPGQPPLPARPPEAAASPSWCRRTPLRSKSRTVTIVESTMAVSLNEYAGKYQHVAMERHDGVLQLTLHTGGNSLRWGPEPHDELWQVFRDVGEDRDNRVVILTGTGDEFTGPMCSDEERPLDHRPTPQGWDHFYWAGKQLQTNLLNIEVPMIAAVNGPAYRHMELALLCDIVLAAEHAVFVDSGHFEHGNLVPGDGVNVAC